jgi:hypothetical protein
MTLVHTAFVEKGLWERNNGHFINIHVLRGVIKIHSRTLPRTPVATAYAASSALASFPSCGLEITILA